MSSINIGVIGAGTISEFHLNAYKANPEAVIYAICDQNAERARGKAELYGAAKVYTDYRELLADPNVHAVSVCTWNDSHAEISIAALRAGKQVLVEKPMTKTVEEALRVQEAVEQTGNVLQVGFVRRFATNVTVAKTFIEQGELGDIYYAKASLLRRLGNPGGWFADKTRSGGGPLIDLGVHMIDLCWYLMGKPKVHSIKGHTYDKLGNRAHIQNINQYKAADWSPDVNTVEDLANALIRFENGASLFVDASFTLHAKKNEIRAVLYGDNGGVEVEPELLFVSEKHNTLLNITPEIQHRTFDFENAFQREIDHFVMCAKTGRKPISPVEDGTEIMKMLCGVYASAESGKEIVYE
ncbi:Gfo/Idh/MocA family protein [Paenibacillus thermoaerophilus]|uniref:Gfo/Idh/MocA family protein n=1 Tax=Paenibacillus thermoaerophilus TaxID=1215385 RepID=A0ABW2V3X6_9BACL|nr:Gfo/Idh/MocA family oxidoreductase [Paenibacillus thermoaerophilus]TMV11151.1 Gfo/Idh/MocA family oxidoreductase [Paenibacillus thermoaerophilus]